MARAGKPNKSKNPDSRLLGLGASLGAQGPQSVGGLEDMAELNNAWVGVVPTQAQWSFLVTGQEQRG